MNQQRREETCEMIWMLSSAFRPLMAIKVMTPCRTEKVDFSKKLKKNKNKNKITKKTNRQEESPEET